VLPALEADLRVVAGHHLSSGISSNGARGPGALVSRVALLPQGHGSKWVGGGVVGVGAVRGGIVRGGDVVRGVRGGVVRVAISRGGVVRGGVVRVAILRGGVVRVAISRGGVVRVAILRGGVVRGGFVVRVARTGGLRGLASRNALVGDGVGIVRKKGVLTPWPPNLPCLTTHSLSLSVFRVLVC